MSTDNALERLMKKQKPQVPNRPDAIEEISLPGKTTVPAALRSSENLNQTEALSNNSTEPEQTQTSHDSKESLSQESQNSLILEDFETIRNTIRVESVIDESLRQLCHKERLTKEIWLEAAYLFLALRPDELAQVNKIARERLESRKAIADRKRAKTMQQRFLT